MFDGIGTANRHHGGRLLFGPDGNLWIGTGDAFEPARAPDRDSLNGKVLRIRPNGTVPADNPFGTPVFSTGHRNVQGLTFGPDGTIYAAELGVTAGLFPPGADTGPEDVAREISRVLALPFGHKPFRTVVDRTGSGVEHVNDTTRRAREYFVTRMGYGELLSPSKLVLGHARSTDARR